MCAIRQYTTGTSVLSSNACMVKSREKSDGQALVEAVHIPYPFVTVWASSYLRGVELKHVWYMFDLINGMS